jgi:hypothetical protein
MSQVTPTRMVERAPRVKLGGSILALIILESKREVRTAVHQLSVNGGLLKMEKPLDEQIKVTLMFHIGATTIRAKAKMLFPMWATNGWLQPFQFLDLADPDKQKLDGELGTLFPKPAPSRAAMAAAVAAKPANTLTPSAETSAAQIVAGIAEVPVSSQTEVSVAARPDRHFPPTSSSAFTLALPPAETSAGEPETIVASMQSAQTAPESAPAAEVANPTPDIASFAAEVQSGDRDDLPEQSADTVEGVSFAPRVAARSSDDSATPCD